jgi:threonylcarbamoyladenosine tRNA methylthiotransferase MtaB
VLTGVDLTSWGADLPATPVLGNLVKRILKLVPDLERLRISSIDSIEADPDLMEALATEPRLMPHLHLSLQAGDNMILKRMKRRHSREDAIAFCNEARALRPDITFGADIIAGFPTETDDMFQNSLALVEECDLTWLHVFPFSARKGTPAARMPAVPGPVIRERAAMLRELGQRQVERHLDAMKDTIQQVLTEGRNIGRTRQFSEVVFDEPQEAGRILTVQITGHDGQRLIGSEAKLHVA